VIAGEDRDEPLGRDEPRRPLERPPEQRAPAPAVAGDAGGASTLMALVEAAGEHDTPEVLCIGWARGGHGSWRRLQVMCHARQFAMTRIYAPAAVAG
jgi:hypothetical protein